MAPLLGDEQTWNYDIIAIQEPWGNKFQQTTYNPIKDRFDLLYQEHDQTRVCFFVNKRLAGRWIHTSHTPDLATLKLWIVGETEEQWINIHNPYKPIPTSNRDDEPSTLPDLNQVLEATPNQKHLVVGDFNLHHPMWASHLERATSQGAEKLLELITEHQLQQLLPTGTRTRQENGEPSTLDLVFGSEEVADCLTSCGLAGKDLDHDSDHLPVATILSITTTSQPSRKRQIWHQLDEKGLQEVVCSKVLQKPEPQDTKTIDSQVEDTVRVLSNAIENNCPESTISPRTVPGWTPEIKEAQMKA